MPLAALSPVADAPGSPVDAPPLTVLIVVTMHWYGLPFAANGCVEIEHVIEVTARW